ncbi:chemotaxis protein CheW [Roseococcus sp. SDR]|uniref:chemotaxis protein CheW n=1 Tax=Roseococcus sp. SDR TaxID=2835532 RepID=UPI001BCF7D8D|nr:chemotaxis protein CheW [Roseococcus sp. SDR]MBS7793148.1 chemotaxis protein CheW [Roseococcus sp. SDR]MBV1848462.1 chemotaxis protein CheW [Roseococcus sp. SDR]
MSRLPLPGGGWFTLAEGEARHAEAPPRPPMPATPRLAGAAPMPPPRRAIGLAALHLSLGGVALAIPSAMAEHINPMPALRPLPGAAPGVAGLAEADGAPVLVLETGFVAGQPAALEEAPSLLLVLREGGRRFALPAARIEAGPAIAATRAFQAWLASPEAAAALAFAPAALEAEALAPVPQRRLVMFQAAGMELALPAEAVVAVLPATQPLPTPRRGLAGLAAHRGAVLPVLDGGLVLGGRPALAGGAAPLIRLALWPEVLVAVEQIGGVRALPAADVTPLAQRDGLVAAFARLGGAPVPILAPHRLGAL